MLLHLSVPCLIRPLVEWVCALYDGIVPDTAFHQKADVYQTRISAMCITGVGHVADLRLIVFLQSQAEVKNIIFLI